MRSLIILLVLIFLYKINLCQSDGKYKKIGTEEYVFHDDVIVENDSLNFSGFLIFEVNKNPYSGYFPVNKDYYSCNIFWINNLSSINDQNARFIFDPFILLERKRCFTGDPSEIEEHQMKKLSVEDEKFCKVLKEYSKNREKNITEVPFLFNRLTTQIFEQEIKFWKLRNIDTVGYFIFYSSFTAVLLKGTLRYTDLNVKIRDENGNETYKFEVIENAQVMLPISKSCDFHPVGGEKLKFEGFKESYWNPENLFNEK